MFVLSGLLEFHPEEVEGLGIQKIQLIFFYYKLRDDQHQHSHFEKIYPKKSHVYVHAPLL